MNAGAEWSQGYVTDVSYTNSYFRELSPVWLNHVAAMQGARPRPLGEGFTHIDLGCGLGQSSIVLAGCLPQGRFYGVDFNPARLKDCVERMEKEKLTDAQKKALSFKQGDVLKMAVIERHDGTGNVGQPVKIADVLLMRVGSNHLGNSWFQLPEVARQRARRQIRASSLASG